MTRRLALTLGGVAALLIVASVPLSALAHQLTFGGVGQLLLMIPFAAVGALVASRQPRNPIGWILLAIAVSASYGADAGFYAVRAYHIDHHSLPLSRLAVFLTQGWASMLVLLPLPILFFPDGKISRLWRWTLGAYVALISVLIVHLSITDFGAFTDHTVRIDSSGELKQLGSSGSNASFVLVVLPFFAISLSWVVRQVVRYRRSTGDRRQQLKWLLAGGSFAVCGFFVAITVGTGNHGNRLGVRESGLPRADRAPDLDRDRDPALSPVRDRPADLEDALVRAADRSARGRLRGSSSCSRRASSRSRLRSASPPRPSPRPACSRRCARRLQRLVDRRFNRARYDAEATVAAFGARLRDAVDVETVLDELAAAAAGSLEPCARHRLGQVMTLARLPRLSPVTLGIVGLILALAALNIVRSTEIPPQTGLKGVGIITLPFAAVGLLVARRRPRNSIGWILLALVFAVLVSVNAANYAVLVYRVHDALPFGRLAVALAPAWIPVLVLAPLPIVLFPEGQHPTRAVGVDILGLHLPRGRIPRRNRLSATFARSRTTRS